jgi:large subunit ribosomal protein L23
MEEIINSSLGSLLQLIKYPSLTEKSINLYGDRQYTFIVDRSLTKIQIKYIIENIFNVKVISVNTSILPTKMRRVGRFIGKRTLYKKAYVKLKEGDTIADLFN